MTEPDRTTLPLSAPEFAGTANRTLRGSEPDWNLIRPPEPPQGAPNVLLVLIDDAGFGNPSTFGGPIETPNYTRMAEGGLRYNRFHVTALCSPTRAALLTGRNNHAVGFGSIGEFSERVPRLHGDAAAGLRAVAADPAGQRLQHRRVRQVAPDAGRAAGRRPGPFDRWPNGWGFDYFYGFLGGGCGPVGPVPGREPEDHRHARRTTTTRRTRTTFPDAMADKTIEWLHGVRGAGRAQAVLRLLLDRLQPRPAPRRRAVGRQVQGQVRPGLGPAARGDLRPAEGSSASSRADAELTPRDEAFPAWDDVPDELQGVLRPPDGGLRRVTRRTPTTTSAG